jgi:hypothetical protein
LLRESALYAHTIYVQNNMSISVANE